MSPLELGQATVQAFCHPLGLGFGVILLKGLCRDNGKANGNYYSGFWVQGLGLKALGFRGLESRIRVYGLGLAIKVWSLGLGFEVRLSVGSWG